MALGEGEQEVVPAPGIGMRMRNLQSYLGLFPSYACGCDVGCREERNLS